MVNVLRRLDDDSTRSDAAPCSDPDNTDLPRYSREWLVTNGLGGYASGTVAGFITRRYHGLLIAALPAPQGRTLMLNHLSARLHLANGSTLVLSGVQDPDGTLVPGPTPHAESFRLEAGLPLWTYAVGDFRIEKRIALLHRQNTAIVSFELTAGGAPVRLELQPWVHFRPHEGPVNEPIAEPYTFSMQGDRYELEKDGLPPLRMQVHGARHAFTIAGDKLVNIRYRIEESRGYDSVGDLYSPGYFSVDLVPGEGPITLLASTEPWEIALAVRPKDALAAEQSRRAKLVARAHPALRGGVGAELVLAADQFVITPAGRLADAARAHAAGDEVRTVIAGYHWFTDWGRDTMISLEGLTLTTGRTEEAAYILRTFAHYVRNGLIPNMFPEGNNAGLYHTADATLWYFHSIDRYVELTGDRSMIAQLLPTLRDIVRRHIEGTSFGIGVDPKDGLLRQGQEGYQLTWMDAKVGDLVVTPRRGKAVEINALFYNALRLYSAWERELGSPELAETVSRHADQAEASFQKRFWYEKGGYLYDLVDGEHGDDPALRPNQLLAISLKHPILERARWEPVVRSAEGALLTPVGLRSLAPSHPDYKPRYFGNLYARDNAYHQGTVWAWLIGPFVDAWLKVHPGAEGEARRFLHGMIPHLSEACVGSISEIFDAEPPFAPRGCIAQAWSVAEVVRLWARTSVDRES